MKTGVLDAPTQAAPIVQLHRPRPAPVRVWRFAYVGRVGVASWRTHMDVGKRLMQAHRHHADHARGQCCEAACYQTLPAGKKGAAAVPGCAFAANLP